MLSSKFFFNLEDGLDTQSIFEKVKKEREEIGYYSLANSQNELVEEILEYKNGLSNLKDLVVIGIGGSSLGSKAVDALLNFQPNRNGIKLTFLENCDPIRLKLDLAQIDKDNSLFIVISKSGSTIETITVYKTVIEQFNLQNSISNRVVFITDRGSSLDKLGEENSIKRFYIYPNVGGRFSVLSAVGLVPLAIIGYDIKALLNGAKSYQERFFENPKEMILKAKYLYQNAKTKPISVLFSYASEFSSLNAWFVQLWGESLGKINRYNENVGLTPVGLIGSIDQHSFLQLIVQGPRDKFVTFIKINNFGVDSVVPDIKLNYLSSTDFINGHKHSDLINAQCDSTLETLVEQNVPVDLIELDTINEESVGEVIIYFELLTSLTGICFEINTYDQPGVEFGKQKLVNKFKKA